MHIKQNDVGCIDIMRKSGCFVRSCGLVAEYQTGEKLSVAQVNDLWLYGKTRHYINNQDNVVESAPIINYALKLLGSKGRFYEVGTFSKGKTSWYPSVPVEMRRSDAVIQKIKQGGPQKYHFRVVDKKGNLIEDPHEPPLKVLGVEYSILYCYEE